MGLYNFLINLYLKLQPLFQLLLIFFISEPPPFLSQSVDHFSSKFIEKIYSIRNVFPQHVTHTSVLSPTSEEGSRYCPYPGSVPLSGTLSSYCFSPNRAPSVFPSPNISLFLIGDSGHYPPAKPRSAHPWTKKHNLESIEVVFTDGDIEGS